MLLTEVDDDLRRERMQALWRQWRKPLLWAALALVIGTAGSTIWRNHQEKQAGLNMQQLNAGLEAFAGEDYAAAYDHFAHLADDSSGALNDLARLWQARALKADGKTQEAQKLFVEIAAAPRGKDLVWRDIACLYAGEAAPKSCADGSESPLKATRAEFAAAALAAAGKTEEAGKRLDAIANDPDATQSQRLRATQLRTTLAAQAK